MPIPASARQICRGNQLLQIEFPAIGQDRQWLSVCPQIKNPLLFLYSRIMVFVVIPVLQKKQKNHADYDKQKKEEPLKVNVWLNVYLFLIIRRPANAPPETAAIPTSRRRGVKGERGDAAGSSFVPFCSVSDELLSALPDAGSVSEPAAYVCSVLSGTVCFAMSAGALTGILETYSERSDAFFGRETDAGVLSTAVWDGLPSCVFGAVEMLPDSGVSPFPSQDSEKFFSVVSVGGTVGAPLGGSAGAFVGGTVGVPLGGAFGASVGGIIGASVGGTAGFSAGGTVGASVGGSVGLVSGISPSSFLSNNPSGGFSNRLPPPRSPPISVEYSNSPVAALRETVT